MNNLCESQCSSAEAPDNYGQGAYIADFEAEVAEMFGMEAAVFMPSGTMAQQIALRIWCERRKNFTVAMHPTAHVEFAEHAGFNFLHDIHRLQFGAPEFMVTRLPNLEDFQSFYKDLGGLAGSVLMGSASLIAEARIWQVRHGGRLKTMSPYLVSARLGMQHVLPQIDGWVARAQEVAAIMASYERIRIKPDPPQANFFQLFIQGDHEELTERHLAIAEETGTFLFHGLKLSEVPGVAVTELHCWENAMQFDLAALRPFLERLLR